MKVRNFTNSLNSTALLNISFKLALFSLILFCSCNNKSATKNIAIAFYNCENLYDTINNPITNDDEFTPTGSKHYTSKVYNQKLHNIGTLIRTMNESKGPDIIGLAEIENNEVLYALQQQPELATRKYKHILFNGPDHRGINVALMYAPDAFTVLTSKSIHVPLDNERTRDILYVCGLLYTDTVHLLVNHWPSRRGDLNKSETKRALAANTCKTTVRSILNQNANAKIIVMGDFNDNPNDNSLREILNAKETIRDSKNNTLYNPFAAIYSKGKGTEVYKHKWNLFDQIIITTGLMHTTELSFDYAEIYKPSFIQDKYKGHEGEPFRTYLGNRWIKGYSDHFPVLIYLSKK